MGHRKLRVERYCPPVSGNSFREPPRSAQRDPELRMPEWHCRTQSRRALKILAGDFVLVLRERPQATRVRRRCLTLS
jgi:hypothetical protein